MNKKIYAIILSMFVLTGCQLSEGSSSTSNETSSTIEESSTIETSSSTEDIESSSQVAISELKEENIVNSEYIRWLGRTYYSPSLKMNFFYYTATGFEVNFYGTSLSAEFYLGTTKTSGTANDIYFSSSIDGEDILDGDVFVIDNSNQTYTISNLEIGYHSFKVMKRSEPQDGMTALKSLTTNGTFLAPSSEKTLKFQIVGASGISGHGALGLPNTARTTANSSSLHSFGYLTARMFDADVQFVSNSGWGLKWGYNPTNNNGEVNIATAYNSVGIDDSERIVNLVYDSNTYVPDVVIVNVGGNDYNAYINNLSSVAKTNAINEFKSSLQSFVTNIHTLFPSTKILWTCTNAGAGNGLAASTVISDLDPLGRWIKLVVIPGAGDDGDVQGANGHAYVTTHIRTAEILANTVVSMINLTRVKDNIVWNS